MDTYMDTGVLKGGCVDEDATHPAYFFRSVGRRVRGRPDIPPPPSHPSAAVLAESTYSTRALFGK